MKAQVIGTISSLFWNWLFVLKFDWGVVGTGLSFTLTTLLVFLINLTYTFMIKDADVVEARQIHFYNAKVFSNVW